MTFPQKDDSQFTMTCHPACSYTKGSNSKSFSKLCSNFKACFLTLGRHRHATDLTSLGAHSTNLQQAKALERSNSLRHKLDAWIEIQHLYIPEIAPLRARADAQGGGTPTAVQDIPLFLPSKCIRVIKNHNLLKYEWEFCYAQASETLGDLCGLILL